MNNLKMSQKNSTAASRKSKAHPTSSGNSCSDRSDDQDSSDGQSNEATVKEEGNSDDEGSHRNSTRGGTKDPSQNVRAKNREHAKNTRLRKKNYIETLKDNIKDVSSIRDIREKDRKLALGKMADQNASRKKTVSTFFIYRASLDTSLDAWNAILANEFTCVIPVTPYRSYPPHQVFDGRRQLVGAAGMVYDTLSMYAMLYSTLKLRPGPTADLPKINMVFEALQDSGIMQDARYMCRWSMRTDGLVPNGAPFELHQSGMLAAEFTHDGAKLRHVELTTDVMSFMQQLRRSTGRDVFQVVPNTAFPLELNTESVLNTAYNNNTNTYFSATNNNGASNNNNINDTINNISPNINNGFTREGAMEAFLGKSEARAVVGAAEPYLLLFSNQRFQEMFQTKGLSFTDCYFPLFSSLIRTGENSGNTVNHIMYYLQNGLPCNGILHCAPASSNGAPQPSLRCLCTFYPLFAGGSVQQFLVAFDQLDQYGSILHSTNHIRNIAGGTEEERQSRSGKMHGVHSSNAEADSNRRHAYEVHYHSLRHHNTTLHPNHSSAQQAITCNGSNNTGSSNNSSSSNLPLAIQAPNAPSLMVNNNTNINITNRTNTILSPYAEGSTANINIIGSAEKAHKSRAGRSRSSHSSGTSHEPTASTHGRYANSHGSAGSAGSAGQALSHNSSIDSGGSVLHCQYPSDTNSNNTEMYGMLLNSSGGITGRLPELPVVSSSGSGSSNAASKSGSNTGSAANSGHNSGEESNSNMTSSPLQIEDFVDLVDAPSHAQQFHTMPPDSACESINLNISTSASGRDKKNLLGLNAANLSSSNNSGGARLNLNGNASLAQFRSLETESSGNFTDLDIDEKFFDQF